LGDEVADKAFDMPDRPGPKPSPGKEPRHCTVCGTKLSTYNPGPNCWQHTIGYPWRGPTAKPKF
jgi:hypothetical protein